MKLVKRYSILLVLIILAFFFPYSLKNHAKLTMRVIITGFAIDKTADNYEVTAQAIIPTIASSGGAGQAKIDFISEEGKSVSDCINSIAYNIGKIAALSHITFVMLGEGVVEENMVGQLDFFSRNDKLPDSLLVLVCDGSAKEAISKTKDLDISVAINMQQVFLDKEQNMNGLMTSLVDVHNSAKNISNALCISGFKISSETKQGGEESSSSSGESGEQSEGTKESGKARIDYQNKIYLFQKGNLIGTLDEEDVLMGFYLSHIKSTYGDIAFEAANDNGEKYYIGINIRDKKESVKASISNGKIITEITIRLASAKIFELTNSATSSGEFYYEKNLKKLEEYRTKTANYIEKTVKTFCDKVKELNFDVFMTADNLFKWCPLEWEAYIKNNGIDDYAKNIEYKVNCIVQDLF